MKNLHPSEYLDRVRDLIIIKAAAIGLLTLSITAAATSATSPKPRKTWLAGSSLGLAIMGCGIKTLERDKKQSLQELQQASTQGWRGLLAQSFLPAAKVSATFNLENYTPPNLITNPVEYIQKKQKHVALIGGTGDGKSTFTQFLSSTIGGKVVVYDSDAKPTDWEWLNQDYVIGRKGNFKAINESMTADLVTLEELVSLRGEQGDEAISGRERFLIAEEFPILTDECESAPTWLKKHAKRGRRYKQFILVIAQNDTAENFGLQGDKGTFYSCFCLVRLGSFGYDHARTKLKDDNLEQWLKVGGKKRFMVDDCPCELDLSTWGTPKTEKEELGIGSEKLGVGEQELGNSSPNEYEQAIIDAGKKLKGDVLKARILKQNSRLFDSMKGEDIRIIFQNLADKGIGETVGKGDRLGWKFTEPADS
jgi:energy-coupling factor transporter ATP-binding protein EcfA2